MDKDESLSMKIRTFDIQNTHSQKLLGVTLDNKLTFTPHVTNMCTKASQKLHALGRVSGYMNLKQRKIIMNYFALLNNSVG